MSQNIKKWEKKFLVYQPGIEQILSAQRSRPPKNQQNPQSYLLRYDKNKTMSLGCDTLFACVSMLVPGSPLCGSPCTSIETQAHPVSQPSDMVLL